MGEAASSGVLGATAHELEAPWWLTMTSLPSCSAFPHFSSHLESDGDNICSTNIRGLLREGESFVN